MKPLKQKRVASRWTALPDGWIKTNVDASRRYSTGSSTIGYVMKDKIGTTIMTKGIQIGDCSIFMAECLAIIRETLVMTIQKKPQKIMLKVINWW